MLGVKLRGGVGGCLGGWGHMHIHVYIYICMYVYVKHLALLNRLGLESFLLPP